MRLLVINQNISDSVSALIEAEARHSAAAGTQITMLTAPFGVAYIETRFEALIGAYATAQLAGAPLAGLARTLRGQLPVPVVDGVSSAVRHAESLVARAPGKAVRGSFAPPPVKPNRGLPDAIARLLAGPTPAQL